MTADNISTIARAALSALEGAARPLMATEVGHAVIAGRHAPPGRATRAGIDAVDELRQAGLARRANTTFPCTWEPTEGKDSDG